MTRAIAILMAAGCIASAAQFEVAVIKPNQSDGSVSNYPSLRNGTLKAQNVSLKTLLSAAYGLSTTRITGPGWIDTEKFDLTGKSPEGVPDTDLQPMLQTLLEERFHLKTHREMKEMPSYDMTLAKDGLKIKLFDAAHPPVTPPNRGGSVMIGAGTMPQLADMLAWAAGRPVIDRTGMAGRFGYVLSFTPMSSQATDTAGPPDLFTAVREQLGINLESRKGPVEILVIDRAERTPSEN